MLCIQLKPASVGNKPVDLFLLWRVVEGAGGYQKVLDLPCSLSLTFLWIYLGSCTVLVQVLIASDVDKTSPRAGFSHERSSQDKLHSFQAQVTQVCTLFAAQNLIVGYTDWIPVCDSSFPQVLHAAEIAAAVDSRAQVQVKTCHVAKPQPYRRDQKCDG